MEEYDEFASDDFDVKAWINAAVASHLELQQQALEAEQSSGASTTGSAVSSLDSHLSSVATKLQAVSSSINAGLEKSMVEVMVSVPRVVTEIERVEAAIKMLHADLDTLTGQLEDIDHGTNAHVETLATLDLVKTNMGDCLHTLTEAASWNALVREVNARFGQEDLKGVAERLEAMASSMDVLKDMPEAEDRSATLQELQRRLETVLQPQLMHDLKKDRVGVLAEYAAMYRQLGRTSVFRAEYCKARAAAAHKRWFASATSPSPGSDAAASAGASGSRLAMWLPSFLEYLQGSLMDERKKTSDLFGSDKSPAVLCELVVTAFQPLLGSFQKQLDASPWPTSVSLLTEVLRFVGQALELAKGASERDLLAVLLSATAAFRQSQDNFGVLERRYLTAELQPILDALEGPPEVRGQGTSAMAMAFTRRMEEISDVSRDGFAVVEKAAARCVELTAGYQARSLLKEGAEVTSTFLKAVRSAARMSRSLATAVLVTSEPGANGAVLTSDASQGNGNPEALVGATGQDFDWQFFGGALGLLGSAGRCQRCFASLEREFASALLQQRAGLFSQSAPRLSSLAQGPTSSSGSALDALGATGTAVGEGLIGNGVSSGTGKGRSNRSLADSGSEEGRVALLRSALGRARLDEDRASRAEVRAALMAVTDPSSALPGDVLPGPAREVRALAAEACSMVFDVCFSPVTARLATVPGLSSWQEDQGEGDQGWGDGADNGWEYDTVPQAYMTQVGEHLLSLLQNLEPFASSDAFQDAAEPTRDLHLLTEPSWRDVGAALDLGETELNLLESLSGAKPLDEDFEDATQGDDQVGDEADGGVGGATAGQEDGEAARFCTAWLLCVGSATVGCLLAKVLSLPRLSERGCRHLVADVKYLSNVFHALDLAAPPILEHVASLASLSQDQALGKLSQESNSGYGRTSTILTKLERKLAKARGISVAAT